MGENQQPPYHHLNDAVLTPANEKIPGVFALFIFTHSLKHYNIFHAKSIKIFIIKNNPRKKSRVLEKHYTIIDTGENLIKRVYNKTSKISNYKIRYIISK